MTDSSVIVYSGRDGRSLWEKTYTYKSWTVETGLTEVGDLNGDGLTDLAVGLNAVTPSRSGRVEFLSGKDGSLIKSLSPPTVVAGFGGALCVLRGPKRKPYLLAVGSSDEIVQQKPVFLRGTVRIYDFASLKLLFTFKATLWDDHYGDSLENLGDIDGDGYDDLAIGAPQYAGSYGQNGYVEVRSGRGMKLLRFIQGRGPYGSAFGTRIAAVGDVDADGVPDMLVGAPEANDLRKFPPKYAVGYAWLLSMKTGSLIREHMGSYAYEYVGQGVAGVGDLDGDKVPDYAVMGPKANPDAGRIVFYSGKTGKRLFYFAGTDVAGIYAIFGWTLRPVGDLDRDGYADLLVQVRAYSRYESFLIVSPRRRPLTRDPSLLSLAKGGTEHFYADAGPANGAKFYWLLGSMKGVLPGLWLGPHFLPLNPDAYFLQLLGSPNSLIPASLGLLDAQGRAQIHWKLPPGLPPSLQGLRLDHAYLVLDPKSLRVDFTSNPVPLLFTK